jgi:hypothetical protein
LFFLFNSSGMLRGSEEVTKDILLTGPDLGLRETDPTNRPYEAR